MEGIDGALLILEKTPFTELTAGATYHAHAQLKKDSGKVPISMEFIQGTGEYDLTNVQSVTITMELDPAAVRKVGKVLATAKLNCTLNHFRTYENTAKNIIRNKGPVASGAA